MRRLEFAAIVFIERYVRCATIPVEDMIMRRILVVCVVVAVMSVAAVTVLLNVPQIMEKSIEWTCSLTHPTDSCLVRMRAMGHVWSRKGDLARAEFWYARAAEGGDAAAMFHLAWVYEKAGEADRRAAMSAAADAARAGVPMQGPAAGDQMPQGNFFRAADWYRKAAEKGFAPAMNNLGELYLAGAGVPQDPAAAFYWHLAGARAGNPVAAINTAVDFGMGRGVGADLAEAEKWRRLTKKPAATDLDDLTLERTKMFGAGVPSRERALLRAAADQKVQVTTEITPLKADLNMPTFHHAREQSDR
jgi:hypothetical protein